MSGQGKPADWIVEARRVKAERLREEKREEAVAALPSVKRRRAERALVRSRHTSTTPRKRGHGKARA